MHSICIEIGLYVQAYISIYADTHACILVHVPIHTESWSTFLRVLKKNWLSLQVRLFTVTYDSFDAVLSCYLVQMLAFQMLRGY